MLPLLIGIGALFVISSGKKKKSSSSSNGGDTSIDIGLIRGTTIDQGLGTPWERCDPPGGYGQFTFAAYGDDGQCMVFWDAGTRAVARAHMEAEMAKLSEAERVDACGPGACNPDPYASDPELFCEWEDNPKSIEVIIRVITKMYPQLSGQEFPMPYNVGVSFFPATVWTLVSQAFLTDICGFNKVT